MTPKVPPKAVVHPKAPLGRVAKIILCYDIGVRNWHAATFFAGLYDDCVLALPESHGCAKILAKQVMLVFTSLTAG